MRIAMIGSRGNPAGVGGVEHVVQGLSRHLVRQGHEVLIYGRADYLAGAPTPEAGQSIITAGFSGKHLDAFTHTGTAVFDVLHRKVDIVHIHSPGPALWSWLPAIASMPIVFTVHAPDWQRTKWSLPAKLALRAGLAVGMRCASAVTAVSENLAEELSQRFSRAVQAVPNGVETVPKDIVPNIIRQWGLEKDKFALHVGRIVPEKKLHILLQAWAQAEMKIPLVIAAEDSEKSYARDCRRIAPSNVIFAGPQHGRALAELYSNAAMVVQPSTLEGASLVLLEAAAYGRCIVAADIPANREILGDEGFYFASDDICDLAQQLGRCYAKTSQRNDLGQKARRRVLDTFAMAEVAAKMDLVYQDVLKGLCE